MAATDDLFFPFSEWIKTPSEFFLPFYINSNMLSMSFNPAAYVFILNYLYIKLDLPHLQPKKYSCI